MSTHRRKYYSKAIDTQCLTRFFKGTVCKTFVPERKINPLWPALAKEESIAHIVPILSHPCCGQIIAVSQKNDTNLGDVTSLLKNVVSPVSAFAMPLHRRENETRMYLHYCITCLLPELPLAPAWGGSTELAFLREMLWVQWRQAKGMTHSIKQQQKTRAGQREERRWQARDKRRANLETVQQEGPTFWACFANLASKGYRNQVGKGPSWSSLMPIITGNGLAQ